MSYSEREDCSLAQKGDSREGARSMGVLGTEVFLGKRSYLNNSWVVLRKVIRWHILYQKAQFVKASICSSRPDLNFVSEHSFDTELAVLIQYLHYRTCSSDSES